MATEKTDIEKTDIEKPEVTAGKSSESSQNKNNKSTDKKAESEKHKSLNKNLEIKDSKIKDSETKDSETKDTETKDSKSQDRQGEQVAKPQDFPWGSYSLGTAALICWFFIESLRAIYGGIVHLTGLFGSAWMSAGLFVYGAVTLTGACFLLWGNLIGVRIAVVGLILIIPTHSSFVYFNSSPMLMFEIVSTVVVAILGVRYLMSETTAPLALQPNDSSLPKHIKLLQGFLVGFGLCCLAALILIMWEPYGQVPLGVP